ncbi:MAG TPA: hypothetical protein VMU18_00040 [Rhodoblastus sp.]|nr:hypothetical protein [Rhodoblastus sp.]
MKRDQLAQMTFLVLATALASALALAAPSGARAATFGDLAAGRDGGPDYAQPSYAPNAYAPNYAPNSYPPGPYAPAPYSGACPNCPSAALAGGPQGAYPAPLNPPASAQIPPGGWTPPEAYLPFGPQANLPNGRLQTWSFGQNNSTTDPFNLTGLSTPFMFVPWSTPLSAWTNAQTWNWWRERAGVQPPYW